MKKTNKILKTVLLIVAFVIAAYLVYSTIIKKDNTDNSSPYNLSEDELMETSLQAIQSFNEKSNLGEYQLLSPIPKGFNASIHNILGNDNDYALGETKDSYYCEKFNGNVCITHLSLSTDNYTFFGTKVGDYVGPIREIMEKEGYQLVSSDPTVLKYTLNYITFSFEINAEQKIVTMAVGICDPNELKRVY